MPAPCEVARGCREGPHEPALLIDRERGKRDEVRRKAMGCHLLGQKLEPAVAVLRSV